MKVGLVSKLDKSNTRTLKKLTITSFLAIVTSLSFFQFLANLEKSGSRIPDAWSVKFYIFINNNLLSYKK